jgi:lipid-A-disaccharide synthase
MVYRVTLLTYLLGRWAVKVPHFAMVNLIAGEEVVPELVQQDFTAETVVAAIRSIIPEGIERGKMIQGLRRVQQMLMGEQPSTLHAAQRAAQAILQLAASRQLSENR